MIRYIIFILIFFITTLHAGYLRKGTKIYSKPTHKSKVLKVVPKNIKIKLLGSKVKNWFRVKYSNVKGYVYLAPSSKSKGKSSGKYGRKGGRSSSASASGGGGGSRGSSSGSSRGKGKYSKKGKASSSSRGSSRGARSASRGSRSSRGGSSAPPRARKLSKREQLKLEHDAAKMRAEANNQEFCSQCWYAKKGSNPGRFEDTNPKISADGQIIPEGKESKPDDSTVVK